MFKKIAFFALFLAVTGLFAATSVDAQRLIKGNFVKSTDTSTDTLIEPEANPAANLDQCQNGANKVPLVPVNCDPGWANGNSNGNNSHYAEGTSIHYRIKFSNLSIGQPYTITLGYDSWHNTSDKNAIDFLTSYSEAAVGYTVTPCDGTQTGCADAPTVVAVPDDPCHTFDNSYPNVREFTGWGMNLTDSAFVSPLNTPALCDAQERQVTVSFIATTTSPVLAWSGHIARALDWNSVGESSASSINGSPYHMRIIANTGWGGQQDRSLSTSAVVTPSAGDASVTGRVTDAYGRAISSAKLTLNNASTGEVEFVYTNTFGYYSFKGLPVGDFFVMTVEHRRYTFVNSSVSFSLDDNIAGLNFQASR